MHTGVPALHVRGESLGHRRLGGVGAGLIYTAYDSWDAFFQNTAGYHAQGIADGGGILQINFFNSSAIPIGQYNGVAGGIGVFECGGKGAWQHT